MERSLRYMPVEREGFFRYIMSSRLNKILFISISLLFVAFYVFFTGMVSFLPYKLVDQPVYVYMASRNINWDTLINLVFNGNILITFTPLALILLSFNALMLAFNIIAMISLLRIPQCCNVKRTSSMTFSAAILASLGLFASCCGGGFLLLILLSTGLWPLLVIFINYGYLFQIIAALVLISNLIYTYTRYKNRVTGLNLYRISNNEKKRK